MPHRPEPAPAGFRLMRYFTLATAVAFVAVGIALYLLQRGEETFFAEAQREQSRFFRQAQEELVRQHEDAARATLLAVHEANHVSLTRVLVNLMWDGDIAPFMAATRGVRIDECLGLPAEPLPPRRRCWGEVSRRITALPTFRALDAKAHDAMRGTAVVKIKVFDLRGVTVYSSEPAQVGEYAGGNAGWRAASEGRPASELTHRDRFSAFDRVVEDRDLISTYVPVRGGLDDAVLGVVELYSDATPLLEQIRAASRRLAEITAGDQARLDAAGLANQAKVESSSDRFLLVVGGLIALLYLTSLAIVRIGQRFIDRQALAQAEAARRELLWHREQVAALSTVAASVAQEVGDPLAVIQGVAAELPDDERGAARQIRAQGERIARMMRQIADVADTARTTDGAIKNDLPHPPSSP